VTYLTPHFTLEEMTTTQVRGWDNTPSPEVQTALLATATQLESVRTLLAKPITINSGYRSVKVNEVVGGAPNSAHITGQAVDFVCPAYGPPLDICIAIEKSPLNFDQLIQEGTWVHLSFAPASRRNIITKTKTGYTAGLAKGTHNAHNA